MGTITQKGKYPEMGMIKIELLKKGWDFSDLANACGVPMRTMNRWQWENYSRPKSRVRVELALGIPIFCGAQEFQARRELIARLGFNPWMAPRKQLRDWARLNAVPDHWAARRSPELIKAIVTHVSSLQPEKQPPEKNRNPAMEPPTLPDVTETLAPNNTKI